MSISSPTALEDINNQLISYEIYDSAARFLGTASVDLPEFTYKTADIEGAGIGGTVSMPSRFLTESLSLTIHWRSLTQYAFHLAEQGAHDLSFYGAVNSYNSGGDSYSLSSGGGAQWGYDRHEMSESFTDEGMIRALSIKIFARCLPKKTSFGTFKPNELMDNESEFEVVNITVEVDDETVLEYDKFNYKLNIYGNDYTTDIRNALGLS